MYVANTSTSYHCILITCCTVVNCSISEEIGPTVKREGLRAHWKVEEKPLYWSAASTADGKGEVIRAKWMSVDNHVHNKHKDHGNIFPVSQHKRLGKRAREIKWFKPRKY